MRVINIKENSAYTLQNDEDIVNIKNFIINNPDLPILLDDDTVFFNKYIVGSLAIKDLLINIHPRIKGMTINHYFEMQLYAAGVLRDDISAFSNESKDFGIQGQIINLFLQELDKLLIDDGLDGHFINIEDYSNVIRGRILVNQIKPLDLKLDKLPIEYPYFTQDTSINKYIKLALDKIRTLLSNNNQRVLFYAVNQHFRNINASYSELFDYENELTLNDYWNIPKYKYVLTLAEKILNNIKINMSNSTTNITAYLVNSNTIFESYIREVINKNSGNSVTKWDEAKIFAEVQNANNEIINKSYIPDVLINYDKNTNSSFAVLDAKNKDINNNNLIDVADLYQLIFYSSSLEAQYSGLVYPSTTQTFSGEITVNSYSYSSFYYFTIDFSLPIRERHYRFISELNNRFK